MPVYVDGARNEFRGMQMCHMLADTVDELHAMADRIGLARKWFQAKSTPHYDLSQSKRKLAVEAGAKELDRKELVAVIRRLRVVKAYAPGEANDEHARHSL